MPAKVTLTVSQGDLKGKQFVFDERTTCIVGRSEDCEPRVPDDESHKTISRHHCLLDINPPDIRVRDFGSLNGTYVNDKKIGQREKGLSPEEGAKQKYLEHDLKHGDLIKLGKTVFGVSIFVPVRCAECSVEIPKDKQAKAAVAPGVHQCEACRAKAAKAGKKEPPKKKSCKCSLCGNEAPAAVADNRQGDYVCDACKKNPFELVKQLLGLASRGAKDLATIEGYTIERELGRGGCGAVYLARKEKTGEEVALKVMLPEVAVDEASKSRFLREIGLTKLLKHRNVVQLRDSGCSGGTFFFTLEFCDGGSVDRLMAKSGGKLSVDEATGIILQALEGLEYAHTVDVSQAAREAGIAVPARGLVHRDLKPHNLFLSGSGNGRIVKVADYGMAKAFDTAGLSGQTRTGTAAGTPLFMPRQQVLNFKYAKPDVDVWAMAASLYFMLTGSGPRDFVMGKDPWSIVLTTSAVPIRKRNSSLPKRLAEVIDHALVDKPNLQVSTAGELKRLLKGAL